jgi:hypothetical protein
VICEGDRGLEWGRLLARQFSKVYVIASKSSCSLFHSSTQHYKSVPCEQLPSFVDVVLFHTGNENLWRNFGLDTKYTFEFNKIGSPSIRKQEDVHPIQRQTLPLDIYDDDIEELFEYVAKSRSLLPTMCFPQPEALPAIFTLCQAYLTIKERVKVVNPLYWLEALDCLQDGKPDRQGVIRFRQALTCELGLIGADDDLYYALYQLLETISQINQLINLSIITDAYFALAERLGISSIEVTSVEIPFTNMKAILCFTGSPAGMTVATVLSTLLDIPKQAIDSSNCHPDWQALRETILVLSESQVVSTLANCRSKGFSGAVLVVSGKSFQKIKRNYRVLRFGEGSHNTFEQPWSLSSLLEKVSDLVPMEPENLRFLQNEINASAYLYEEKVAPSLKRLKTLDNKLQSLVEVQEAVKAMTTETPVACHAMVTIGNEKKQVQQHLQIALEMLEDHKRYQQGIQHLEKAFEAWRERIALVTEVPI